MSVLVLADEDDRTAGRVAAELAGRGVAVNSFDVADFPQRLALSAEIGPGQTWARDLGRPVIYKPLSGIWHADEGQVRVLYTTVVDHVNDLLDPALSYTAHLLQAQINAAREVRAVVVGNEVFTVAIDSPAAAEVDWRATYGSHRYERIELPAEVDSRLVELHRRLGLIFGAADLALDADTGRWTFYETNQRGEWGWLAEETGITVATALADILQSGQWPRT